MMKQREADSESMKSQPYVVANNSSHSQKRKVKKASIVTKLAVSPYKERETKIDFKGEKEIVVDSKMATQELKREIDKAFEIDLRE